MIAKKNLKLIIALFLLGASLGCFHEKNKKDSEAALLLGLLPQPVQDLEIVGNWTDNYGGSHVITNASWDYNTTGYTQQSVIVEYHNASNTLYSQDQSNNLYSRVVWTQIANNQFYSCTIVYYKATLEEAKNDPATADATDPATGGCGGFSWSLMTRN